MASCAMGLLLVMAAGCQPFPAKSGKGLLLRKPRIAPETVMLEVFSVHYRRDEPQLYESIWAEIDEQTVPPEVRKRLSENGFRVGTVSGHLPQPVQRLLELHSQPTPDVNPDEQRANVVTFDGRPNVRIQQMQLPARQRGGVAASGVYESASLLYREEGQLVGQSFQQCQGMLALKSFPSGDGRVRLEIVPEVHYGSSRRQFRNVNGVMRLDPGRPRKAFTELAQEITLSPGDFYVLSSWPQRRGSLGEHFFTVAASDPPQRKVLFVRLAQTQLDDLFIADPE